MKIYVAAAIEALRKKGQGETQKTINLKLMVF
jgi:hypothetical protein